MENTSILELVHARMLKKAVRDPNMAMYHGVGSVHSPGLHDFAPSGHSGSFFLAPKPQSECCELSLTCISSSLLRHRSSGKLEPPNGARACKHLAGVLSGASAVCEIRELKWTRSSSKKVRIRVTLFSVVYFRKGTLPQKRNGKETALP